MKFRSLVLLAFALGAGILELPCFATPSWATTSRGPLDIVERGEVQVALKAGTVPSSLKAIAELPDVGLRYNIMGSLALYIDRTFGREKLKALMEVNSQTAVLSSLGQSEQVFLTGWRRFVANGAFAASAPATGHS